MRQYQGCTRACLSERYFGMAVVYFYVLEILCSKHWDLHADLLLCASRCTPMSWMSCHWRVSFPTFAITFDIYTLWLQGNNWKLKLEPCCSTPLISIIAGDCLATWGSVLFLLVTHLPSDTASIVCLASRVWWLICGTNGPLGILLLHKATSYLLVLTFCHFSLHIFLWSAVSKRASGFSGPVVLRILVKKYRRI